MSSYYIHPGKNLTVVLVNPPLNNNNYHGWARWMKRSMISKNKYKFLDGFINVPDASEKCNNIFHSWILNSISPSIAQSIVYIGFVDV
uniref:Retrotransposon Copia-like N-terminal domain-containing protein n=1 Tax=Cajanus cajan TaxID=3821 RepID=A0A151T1K4_CAJCA|nr:hypothetical protein KK1_023337 [Cajanus cajan]